MDRPNELIALLDRAEQYEMVRLSVAAALRLARYIQGLEKLAKVVDRIEGDLTEAYTQGRIDFAQFIASTKLLSQYQSEPEAKS